MSHQRSPLDKYGTLVRNHKKPMACRYCRNPFYARAIEDHFFDVHRDVLPSRHCCPWCAGQYSWGRGEKTQHAAHLSTCFKRYWRQFPPPLPPSEPPPLSLAPVPYDDGFPFVHPWRPISSLRSLAGRPQLAPASLYALFGTLPALRTDETLAWYGPNEGNNALTFVDCHQRGVEYVRKFLAMRGSSVRWYHLMVRAYAFETFVARFEAYVDPSDDRKRHRAFLLEYSCLCDGGDTDRDPKFQHHRHLIAVARDGDEFIRECWKKVKMKKDPDAPVSRYKLYKLIKTWQHLQNTLYYVSSPRSSCDFKKKKDSEQPWSEELCLEDETGHSHYHIFTPVTPTFKLCVAVSVEGGLQDYLTRIKGQCSVESFAPHAVLKLQAKHRKYAVPIRHVIDPTEERDLMYSVVPVTKEWVPSGRIDKKTSGAYVTLMDGHRMHFEKRKVEGEGEEAWGRMQGERGNRFLEAVKDDFWFPPSNQQQILRQVVPLLQEMEREKTRNAEQKADYERRLEEQKAECERRLEKEQKRHDHLIELVMKHTDEKTKIVIKNYQKGDGNGNINTFDPSLSQRSDG